MNIKNMYDMDYNTIKLLKSKVTEITSEIDDDILSNLYYNFMLDPMEYENYIVELMLIETQHSIFVTSNTIC